MSQPPIPASAQQKRIEELEEAILYASLILVRSNDPDALEALRSFDNVMDPDAMKRMGI